MAKLFISQERLDIWNAEDRISLDGDTLRLTESGKAFRICPAVRFLAVAGDDVDEAELLGTVRDEEALATLEADHYMDSCIVGEVAYEVQSGFLGSPLHD